MKKWFLFLACLLGLVALQAQQPKRVYITLDVSGSMTGDKYLLANYTAQMIITLCDADDEVYMIVYGKDKCFSKEKEPLKILQVPQDKLHFGLVTDYESQIDDIDGFNSVYKPSKQYQDWLFIIGDGYWDTESYSKITKKFQSIVGGGTLNVCYLQTGHSMTEYSDFTAFIETLGVVDIGKSSIETKTIKAGCDHFAKKILGFSEVGMDIKSSSSNCLSVKVELPVQELLLVYQDDVKPVVLPNVSQAEAGEKQLKYIYKGTPTTDPMRTSSEVLLSGSVWKLTADAPISAGSEISVCFDKKIDIKNVSIYPLVKDVEFGASCFTPIGENLKQLDSQTFSICRDENTAMVRIELSEKAKQNLPEHMLKKTNVVVKANNKEYKTTYKDGGFECVIDLVDDETQYYAECDCPGYLKRVTPITKIIKSECKSVQPDMEVTEMDTIEIAPRTFHQLEIEPIRGTLHEMGDEDNTLDPKKFDIDVEVDNPYLFEEPKVTFDEDVIQIDLRPKGGWCECLFPKDVNIRLVSTPKEGAFNDENKQFTKTVHPIHFTLEKERPWFLRCLWVLLTIVGLILFSVYLRALLKKKRFKKSARIDYTFMELKGSRLRETDLQRGIKLREKTFLAWVKRWLVPYLDERRSYNWRVPAAGNITFVASKSKEWVYITKESFNPLRMKMGDYDPKENEAELVEMDDDIKVYQNKKYQGKLEYMGGNVNDEKYYKMAIWILWFVTIAAIATLVVLLIRSLL